MTLLRLVALGKSYGGVVALQGFNLEVATGEIVGLMGANGAGKTTAFGLIAGTQLPSRGEIWFDGRRIDGLPPPAVNRLGIARTFQIVRPFGSLSILENVAVAELYGSRRERSAAAAADRAMAILAETGLAERAADPADTLTLAGRKRLEVARALATEPRLLLLDEVLAGLTAAEIAEALDLIRRIRARRRLTLVVIEHVMDALMRLAERIVVLHHGEKIAEGPPGEVVADQRVLDAYFGTRRP